MELRIARTVFLAGLFGSEGLLSAAVITPSYDFTDNSDPKCDQWQASLTSPNMASQSDPATQTRLSSASTVWPTANPVLSMLRSFDLSIGGTILDGPSLVVACIRRRRRTAASSTCTADGIRTLAGLAGRSCCLESQQLILNRVARPTGVDHYSFRLTSSKRGLFRVHHRSTTTTTKPPPRDTISLFWQLRPYSHVRKQKT